TGNIYALKVYKEEVNWDKIERSAELSLSLQHPNLMSCKTFFTDRVLNPTPYRNPSVHLMTVYTCL
ncbi:unnamed protein product, partial [marine sediment metagenome]